MPFPKAYLNDWPRTVNNSGAGKSQHQKLHESRRILAGISGPFIRNGKLTERLTHYGGNRPWRSRQPRGDV